MTKPTSTPLQIAIRHALVLAALPFAATVFAQESKPVANKTEDQTAPEEAPASTEEDIELLDGIEVKGARTRGKEADNEEERANAGVTEVLSNAQLTVAGDSDTSAALKRVTGLSTVGGKFVYVRGLGERYSSVLLNGAQIPSPDPLRRVVPLDLFPTDVLDSVTVQKSYSADMPGEFAGGALLLRSKEAQESTYLKGNASIGYLSGSTGQSGLSYRGGSNDYLGHSNSSRALPNSVSALTTTTSATARQQAGVELASKGFDLRNKNYDAPVSLGFSAGGAKEFDALKLSSNVGVRYAQSFDDIEELRQTFASGGANQPLLLNKRLERQRGERNVDFSALLSLSASFAEAQRLDFTSILLRQTTDQAQTEVGFTDSPDEISRYNELEWVENSLWVNQLGGSHYFSDLHELAIDWKVTDANATRDAPLKRRYRYDLVQGQFEFSRRTDGNDISDETLDDNARQYQLSAQMPFSYGDDWFVNYLTGFSVLQRDRDSDIRRFKYSVAGSSVTNQALLRRPLDQILVPANIGPNGFQLTEITRSVDNYSAAQDLDAMFFTADLNYQDLWRINVGARLERNDQLVSTFDRNSPLLGTIQGKIKSTDTLPSLSVGYTLNETSQLRFAYSKTMSRPDFRELSPAPFFDPILDVESSGNPNLQQTTINNFDLRYEYYADLGGQFSAAIFNKRFDKPIERIVVPGTGELLSYENAKSGDVRGLEIEGYLPLTDYLPENFWNRDQAFVAANAAVMSSSVELGSGANFQTNRNRSLQGQSNALINLQLGYSQSPDSKFSGVLSFNRAAKRIAQVGVLGAPDIFEQPFAQLDINVRYQLAEQWSLGFKIKNLLNQAVEFTQGGGVVRSYKPGTEAQFSVEFKPSLSGR